MKPVNRNITLALYLLIGLTVAVFNDPLFGQDDTHQDQLLAHLFELETSDSIAAQLRYDKIDSVGRIYRSRGDSCNALRAEMLLALPLNRLGLQDSSIAILTDMWPTVRDQCDKGLYVKLLALLTNTLLQMEDYARIDSISKAYPIKSLFPENEGGIDQISLLSTYGEVAAAMGDLEQQYYYFSRGLELATRLEDDYWKQKMLTNLGICHANLDNLDSAYICFQKAAVIGQRINNKDDQIRDVINLANLNLLMGDPVSALDLMDSLSQATDSIDGLETKTLFWYTMYNIHSELGNTEAALTSLDAYVSDREKLLDQERIQAVADMLEKYEAEKKAREIEALTVEKLNADLRNSQIARTRNVLLFSGVGMLLLALGLWSRLTFVRKSRMEVQAERDRSDNLLLNILPMDVARELKYSGKASAKSIQNVTILFSDFVGFTKISEGMHPSELVTRLDQYFKAFDGIMKKHGIEKIKTIGDAYMAAGGLSSDQEHAAKAVVMAALEMRDLIETTKHDKIAHGLPFFETRIGINTGNVVSGVVGETKFQFDIWGDSVNLASRMESSGQTGKVNISESTYQLLRDDPELRFENRGKLPVKGKGEVPMYFVERA